MADRFPSPPDPLPATPIGDLDAALERLTDRKAAFVAMDLDAKLRLLDALIQRLFAEADAWTALEARAKGAWPGSGEWGEVYASGPVPTARHLRLLKIALTEVRDHGAPRVRDADLSERADGRLVVQVFPYDLWDRAAFIGYSAEVWMQPGVTRANLRDHQAGTFRAPPREGRVALVLGAGNQSSIPMTDALHKLFVEHQVVLIKMNPVNEYLGPVFRRIFQPLVDAGFVEVVYGGAEVGSYLCQHAAIDEIHITGSDQTHDAIVWGPREGRAERKARGERALTKEISSELGNVTPILVVPGEWSAGDLAFHAESVAAMVANNASFNCIAGKLLVTSRDWPQRRAFLDAVRAALRATPAKKAYYPGARDRWRQFTASHPQAEALIEDHADIVPWTLIPDLNPDDAADVCFRSEPFCGVLHEVALPGAHAVDFLPRAVQFCNDTVWGTLAAHLVIHPSTRKDPASEAAFQEALDDLRYGTIAVNQWAGLGFALMSTPWGAYPGHPLEDIQSGRGVVHNTFLFDKPQKAVVYGPFRPILKPVWFQSHRGIARLAPPLTRYQADPGLLRLLRILPHAMG